jgi:predicted enzyme related to lactoylglutathione lyase
VLAAHTEAIGHRTGGNTMKIKLTSVFVDDPLKAFQFYTEVLGFVSRMYVPEAYLAIVASPEEPDGTGLLLEPNNNPLAQSYQQGLFTAGLPAIVFGVEDVQAEFKRLQDQGVVFRGAPETNEWGTQAIFEDGCGNLIQLHQS